MDAKKQKAIDYCRSLYCDVKENGQKKYTLQEIEKKVKSERKFSVSYSTISKWAVKYNWEDTFTKLKQAGIEKAKGDIDNKIIDEKAQAIADIYKSNKNIQRLTQQTILSRLTGQPLKDKEGNEIKADVGTTDLVRLLQHSEQTILLLQDKGNKDTDSSKHNIIIMPADGHED